MNKHAESNGKNEEKLTKFDRSCIKFTSVTTSRGGHGLWWAWCRAWAWCNAPLADCCRYICIYFGSKVHKDTPKFSILSNEISNFSGDTFFLHPTLKNYFRSTVNEDRLNGLSHLYTNRDGLPRRYWGVFAV